MKVQCTDSKVYLGTGAGETYLWKTVKKAQSSVKIVSPYTHASYIMDLLRLQEKRVDVTLITSDQIEEGQDWGDYPGLKHQDIIKQKRHVDEQALRKRKTGLLITRILLAMLGSVAAILVYKGIKLSILAIIGSLLAFFLAFNYFNNIKVYSYTYFSPLKRLVILISPHEKSPWWRDTIKQTHPTNPFVHAKIFVVDDKVAFLGSVNMTNPGLSKNYESLIEISDPKAVAAISAEIDETLANGTHWPKVDLQEWGKQLYPEPRN